jgi:hypothetical protein
VAKALVGRNFQTVAGVISFTASSHLGSPKVYLTKVQGTQLVTTNTALTFSK